MPSSAAHKHDKITWDDYQSWPDDERWEIIDGEAYAMSPSPTPRHQDILRELMKPLDAFFKKRQCRVFTAPLDVKLSEYDIVQPDLLVVCDQRQLKRTHVEGSPALVVEITSSVDSRDRVLKLHLYAKAGVKEYWIVTPFPSSVEVFQLDGTSYRLANAYGRDAVLASPSFPGLKVRLKNIFDFPLDADERGAILRLRERPAQYGNKCISGLRRQLKREVKKAPKAILPSKLL